MNSYPSRLLVGICLLCVSLVIRAGDIPDRADVPEKDKWDLAAMYVSTAAWEADFSKVEAKIDAGSAYKGRLAESGKTLLAAIQESESTGRVVAKVYVYAGMKSHVDQGNSAHAEMFSRAQTLSSAYGEMMSFFSPELMAIEPGRLEQMVEQTPGLEMYSHYLDEELRLRPFTLSQREEKLLAMAGDPLGKFNRVFGAFNNADVRFGEIKDEQGNLVELTDSRYGAFLVSTNRDVRRDAWTGLFKEYEKMGNTLAANYEGHVKSRVFLARARGYESARHSATYRSAIPEAVYDNVVAVAREGAPLLQRYLKLRQQALGVEQLEIWDLYAPIVEPELTDIPWDEAKQIVADGLAPLGEEYLALYWRGFEERWVDVYENRGKRGGAYSWGMYDSMPYMLLNYQGKLSDLNTLAHEYGHSLHSWLSRNTQPYAYGSYRTFIAEIASMANEALLLRHMLDNAKTPQMKAFLLQNYLDRFRGSFFRQASFADFEMQAHAKVEAGAALSKGSLDELYASVFDAYYADSVNVHPLNASEWSRIPHFLRTDNFYVYQYATSFAAATALASQILEEGEPARERFVAMLRSGSNDYPIELLKKAGVDMTTRKPMEAVLVVFEEMLEELETVLAQI
jgi:oligoendopeptidase F